MDEDQAQVSYLVNAFLIGINVAGSGVIQDMCSHFNETLPASKSTVKAKR
jgi:hypothetical protein